MFTPNLTAFPAPAGGYPVRVFIYGGSFISGSSASPVYNGCSAAANSGAVIVTMNYRVAQFGFFANADVQTQANGAAFGNWGLMDQRLSLQWVQVRFAFLSFMMTFCGLQFPLADFVFWFDW